MSVGLRSSVRSHVRWSPVIAGCVACTLLVGCDSGPPPRGKSEFHEANLKITSDKEGVAHGNTALAKEMAQEFSELMGAADKAAFTGHKKRLVSLTGEKFVTYCHHNGDKIVFLVHVPQLKNYKDDVRDALINLAWMAASEIVDDKGEGKFKQLGVGLRGSLMYGGLAIGEVGSESPKTENAAAVDDDKLFPFFAVPLAGEGKKLTK
jgi:hypothetical protein